jgi:hypothetical protein
MHAYRDQVIQGLDLANTNRRIKTSQKKSKVRAYHERHPYHPSTLEIKTGPAVMVYPKVVNAQRSPVLKIHASLLYSAQNRHLPSATGHRCERSGAPRSRRILSQASVRG